MLTDQHRLLIAAHVDGELSPARRQAVERLLDRSEDARALFRKLQADARRIQNLSRRAVPGDFVERVLSRLPSNDGEIVLKLAATRPDSVRVYLTQILAAAAVLFVGVGIGLYWLFTAGPEGPRPAREIAERRPPAHVGSSAAPIVDPPPPSVEPPPPQPLTDHNAANAAPPTPPATPTVEPAVTAEPAAPIPVLTAPARSPVRFEEVIPVRLSVPMSLRSLVNWDAFSRLRDELTKDSAHRVEIFCRDPSRVADRLTVGCRELNVRLVVDSTVQQLQKQRLRQPYLLFADTFTADEWAVFFHNLGYNDRRAEEKRPGDAIFDQLVITPLMPATDQKELVNLMGTDILTPVSRPVGSGKSDDAKSKPKPLVRQALLVPYQPHRLSPLATKEIKQFLDARQERRDGHLALLVVIKPL